jgi:holo-[acyl-carrier protein] synthase
MKIIGIGTDIVEVLRIARMIEQHGETFLRRVYTDREIAYCSSRRRVNEHYAGRFAAKEAILKALGTGWNRGVDWRDIEIRNEPIGRPQIAFAGVAREICEEQRIAEMLISISHCRSYATAYALATGEE